MTTALSVSLLDDALAYFDRGLSVVVLHHTLPSGACSCSDQDCTHHGKHPRFSDWARRAARSSREDLTRDLTQHPSANIGILTGNWSHIPNPRERLWVTVLDVDAKPDNLGRTGLETLVDLETAHGRIPDTASVKTRGYGIHYYFTHKVKLATRSGIAPGIDIRADGNGQVVAPHSPGYFWDAELTTPLADVPPWLLALATAPTKRAPRQNVPVPEDASWPAVPLRVARALAYVAKRPGAISGQGGHNDTFRAALTVVRGFGLSVEAGLYVMQTWNRKCSPPWSDKDLTHKVQEASARGETPWGSMLTARPTLTVVTPHDPETGEVSDHTSDDEPPAPTPPRTERVWQDALLRGKHNTLKSLLTNAILILRNDPGWQGLYLDEFSRKVMLSTQPPSHRRGEFPRPWNDNDDRLVVDWLQTAYGMTATPTMASDASQVVADERSVHPVREYLSSLRWDGRQRLSKWLHSYLGAADTDYHSTVGSKFLVQAVARVMQPGCQADVMLVLEGVQGAGKTSSVRSLFGDQWYSSQLSSVESKDSSVDLAGVWCNEQDELDQLSAGRVTALKSFISRRVDHYRSPYGRCSEDHKRQCVFVGTTNDSQYLQDQTGNRRFWPVAAGPRADVKAIERDRDQLWAEAVSEYHDGRSWHCEDAATLAGVQDEQQQRMIEDPWEHDVERWASSPEAAMFEAKLDVTSSRIYDRALRGDVAKMTQRESRRICAIMRKIGWDYRTVRMDGCFRKCFRLCRES